MGDWAVVADVEARLQWLGAFSASTRPTSTQVGTWIDDAEALVRNELRAAGVGVTFSAGSDAARELKRVVLDYVEGYVRQARDATGLDEPNDDGLVQLDRFEKWIDDLRRNPDRVSAKLEGATSSDAMQVRSYWTSGRDGKSIAAGDFEPTFKKGGVF